jgi:hypothetical protein
VIGPAAESELGEVAHFLCEVFAVSEDHRMFQSDVLRWKCFAPHPFWEGSRGYILRHKGAIAAFGCVMPCRFLTAAESVFSCDVIDWAASKAVPGAGAMLYRHVQHLAGTMINIGGTPEACAVLPRMGFDLRQQRYTCTRVLRPWQHFAAGPKDWKAPLRLARDYRELAFPIRAGADALQTRRVDSFQGAAPEMFPDPAVTGQVVCARTPQLLDYFLACPAARMEAWLFEYGSQPAGYMLLSRVGRDCRIADLWLRSADAHMWAGAYTAAATAALGDPATTRITIAASVSFQMGALRQAGYRRISAEPVFVLDPRALLRGRSDLVLNLAENDAFYWSLTR